MHKTPGKFSLDPNIGSVTTFRLSLYILQMRILSANNRYRFFTRPLKTNSFYIFSSLFVIKCGSYIIRYTGIYSTKIDICLYAVFFKLRTEIITDKESKFLSSSFATGEYLIGAWFFLWLNGGYRYSLLLISLNEFGEIKGVGFQITVKHSKARGIFGIVSLCG